ncbi:MAG TPA: hypothetical protein VF992_07600 [Thermoplasmata archaeon]
MGSSPNVRRALVGVSVVLAAFVIAAGLSGVASAGRPSGVRAFLVGSGFLCGEEGACPDVSRADNGDTVEIAGDGTFNPATRNATGSGTFVHHLADGTVFAHGTWDVVGLISFKSFGTVDFDGTTIEGGLALLRVAIHPSEFPGVTFSGVLTVDCLVGSAPAGADEGVRLNVQDTPFNFNTEVSGETLFLPQ